MERRGALTAVLAVALIGAAGLVRLTVLDQRAAERRNAQQLDEDVLRSPGPDLLQIAAMEHAPAWADLLWLQIVQELGKQAEGEKASYDRLQRWANIAVDLDPKYFTVYWASAINLIAYAKRARAAEALLEKGELHLPDRWEFPFLIGYVYFFLRGDALTASQRWEEAVPKPQAPRFLPSLAARARKFSGDEQGAIDILEMMIGTLEGPQKEDAEIRLKILKSEGPLGRYDDACKRFLIERGRRPKDGAELYAEKYIQDPPVDLFGGAITIDDDCRARTEIIRVRDDEATKMVGSQAPTIEELQSEKDLEGNQ